jgi:hypothetical protein
MKLAILCSFMVLSTLPRIAAQPWEKPIEKWSDADARRVLSASPWAKRTTPKLRSASGAPDRGPALLSKVTVRWESAMPVKQAHRKRGSVPVADDGKSYYAIGIAGFRPDASEAQFEPSAPEASLRYCDRDPAAATSVRVLRDADGHPFIVFLFPVTGAIREPGIFRPFPIAFRPNKFHFVAQIGPIEIRQTFSLRDMLYLRHLEL